jgi:CheY-like chemotaxis protein
MNTADCLANRYFLVVDDEAFIRTLVARFLKKAGAAGVVEAADGREAIAAIGSYDMVFDAVISDVRMRPMNGLELLSAIRTGEGGLKRNTPVLMLTAHAEAGLVTDALALDADAFVVKPVERDALIERVLRVLERTVTIQPVAAYQAAGIAQPIVLGPAPPTKPLRLSVEAFTAPSPDATAIPSPPRRTAAGGGKPLAEAHKVALDLVRVNSILAKDIYFDVADAPKLLVAAPAILTQVLLDRLKDLRQVHDSYSHVYVIEPRI